MTFLETMPYATFFAGLTVYMIGMGMGRWGSLSLACAIMFVGIVCGVVSIILGV